MRPDEVHLRVDYFHDASDDYLAALGVDRARLPSRTDWQESMRSDLSRPVCERSMHFLVWELEGRVVGFSTADRIVAGDEAFMHLHILDPGRRRGGLGARFVRLSGEEYIRVLRLERVFSEPNALNVAPNRALQRAGFRYVLSRRCTPSPINFLQVVTRWVLEREGLAPPSDGPHGAGLGGGRG